MRVWLLSVAWVLVGLPTGLGNEERPVLAEFSTDPGSVGRVRFGQAVAVHGDVALVGARYDSSPYPSTGAAYVYRFDGQSWNYEQSLRSPEPRGGESFGTQVAIAADQLIISAPGRNDGQGAIHVYEHDGVEWTHVQEFDVWGAGPGFYNGAFGERLALHEDTMIAVANHDNGDLFWGSSVHVFDRIDGVWTETGVIERDDAKDLDAFGYGLDLEGDRAVISREALVPSEVFVYERSGNDWIERAALTPPSQTEFASGLDLNGERFAAYLRHEDGQGLVALYHHDAGQWDLESLLQPVDSLRYDRFGQALQLAGTSLLIGAPAPAQGIEGRVYSYGFDGSAWVETDMWISPRGVPDDEFGSALARQAGTLVVGAAEDPTEGPEAGASFFYRWNGNAYDPVDEVFPRPSENTLQRLGRALAADDRWFVGSNDFGSGGSLEVREFRDGDWFESATLVGKSTVPDADRAQFGWAIDSNGEGVFVVGSPGTGDWGPETGCAYMVVEGANRLFRRNRFWPDYDATGDRFGTSVGISGQKIAVGSPGDDASGEDSGSVSYWFYDAARPHFRQLLSGPGTPAGAEFGASLAIDGDRLVVGAPGEGAAYVFEFDGALWEFSTKFVGIPGSWFGYSVGLVGDRIVVGAPFATSLGDAAGAAHVYAFDGTGWVEEGPLIPGELEAYDLYGWSVELRASTLAIGAMRDDDAFGNGGAVYVYDLVEGQWTPEAKILPEGGGASAEFGTAIAINRRHLFVGIPGSDVISPDAGLVSVYAATQSLTLDISPQRVSEIDPLHFEVYYGAPDAGLLLAIVNVNDVPVFNPVVVTSFPHDGFWNLSGIVPPGLGGIVAIFQGFGIGACGEPEQTNQRVVIFE